MLRPNEAISLLWWVMAAARRRSGSPTIKVEETEIERLARHSIRAPSTLDGEPPRVRVVEPPVRGSSPHVVERSRLARGSNPVAVERESSRPMLPPEQPTTTRLPLLLALIALIAIAAFLILLGMRWG
jgi:hypothetical protein